MGDHAASRQPLASQARRLNNVAIRHGATITTISLTAASTIHPAAARCDAPSEWRCRPGRGRPVRSLGRLRRRHAVVVRPDGRARSAAAQGVEALRRRHGWRRRCGTGRRLRGRRLPPRQLREIQRRERPRARARRGRRRRHARQSVRAVLRGAGPRGRAAPATATPPAGRRRRRAQALARQAAITVAETREQVEPPRAVAARRRCRAPPGSPPRRQCRTRRGPWLHTGAARSRERV